MNAIGLSFTGYLLTGVFAVLFPSIMPTVIQGFGLSLAAAGLVYPSRAVGSLLGATIGGVVSDVAGRRALLAGSAGLLTIGMAWAAYAHQWAYFLVGFFIAGIAQGALTTGINAVTAEAAGQHGAKMLNRLHGTYSIGAAVSPVAVGWLLSSGAGWRSVLWWLVGIWLVYTISSFISRYTADSTTSKQKRGSFRSLLTHPVLLLAGAVAFTYNGVAWSLIGWVNTYLQSEAGLPAVLATGMLTLFYAALAGGRFACASLAARFGNGRVLLACALGSAVAYPLVLMRPWPMVAVLGVLFSGLFLSGLYPTALACAARFSPGNAGTVAGALSTAMTLGTMIPPWWTGIMAEFYGLQLALGLNYAMVVCLVLAAWRMSRFLSDHEGRKAEGNAAATAS